jgi:uridine kinase
MFRVKYQGKEKEFDKKISLLSLLDNSEKYSYLVAKVNNRLRELTYEVNYDCEVEFLGFDNYNAIRVYETSLRYLIALAFEKLYPELEIRFSYNVSRSLFCQILDNKKAIDNDLLVKLNNKMKELIAKDIPFNRKIFTNQEALQIYKERGFEDKVASLAYRPEKTVHFYECDGYLNYMYGYMVPSTGYLRQYILRLHLPGIIIQYPRSELDGQIGPFEYASTYGHTLKEAYLWAKRIDAETVAKVNQQTDNGNKVDFINICETKHNNMLAELGDIIKKDINADIIIIAI